MVKQRSFFSFGILVCAFFCSFDAGLAAVRENPVNGLLQQVPLADKKPSKFRKFVSKHKKGIIGTTIGVVVALPLAYLGLRIGGGVAACPRKFFGHASWDKSSCEYWLEKVNKGDLASQVNLTDKVGDLHYLISRPKTGIADASLPIILNLTNNGNTSYNEQRNAIKIVQETGCPVVTIDYPGVCGGKGFAWTVFDCTDAITKQLERLQQSEEDFKGRPVVVRGEVFGAYIGAWIAAEKQYPILMDCPLTSAGDYIAHNSILPKCIARKMAEWCEFEINQAKLVEVLLDKKKPVVIIDAADQVTCLKKANSDIRLGKRIEQDDNVICMQYGAYKRCKDCSAKDEKIAGHGVQVETCQVQSYSPDPSKPLAVPLQKFTQDLAGKSCRHPADAAISFIEACK